MTADNICRTYIDQLADDIKKQYKDLRILMNDMTRWEEKVD